MSARANATRRAPLLGAYTLAVFAFLYLPIAVLVLYSFNKDGVGGFPPKHFTLDWYRQLFRDASIWDSFLNSLLVAVAAVVLALTLGLLVDTSRSQSNVLDAERNASRSFLDQMMVQEKDKAFLIHFDREVELLQDVTSSREKLQSALELLKTSSDPERSNDPKDADDSKGSGSRTHGTPLYDAIYLASNENHHPGESRNPVATHPSPAPAPRSRRR